MMSWTQGVACFAAGLFLVNAIPHFVKGSCGDRFPTPFAHPPGRGLSSPTVNVLWALVNVALGLLMAHAGGLWSGGCVGRWLAATAAALLALGGSWRFAQKHKDIA